MLGAQAKGQSPCEDWPCLSDSLIEGVQAELHRLKGFRLKAEVLGTFNSDLQPEPLNPFSLSSSA